MPSVRTINNRRRKAIRRRNSYWMDIESIPGTLTVYDKGQHRKYTIEVDRAASSYTVIGENCEFVVYPERFKAYLDELKLATQGDRPNRS